MERQETRNTRMAVVVLVGLLIALPSFSAQAQFSILRILGFNITLAGHDLNGVSLNGTVLDGQRIEGVSTTDVLLDGELMEAVWLEESYLEGSDYRGKHVARNKMIGAVFSATLEDGEEIALRMEDMRRHDAQENHDVWVYEVSYATDDGWLPLCGEDDFGEPIPAIAVSGTWDLSEGTETGGSHYSDDDEFTFACQGYVIAKCVEAGYKPWKRTKQCVSGEGCTQGDLSDYHQACTRMLRADYCGNGISHTVDGTAVNVYDSIGVRYDAADWATEAEWDEDGAICAVTERISGDAPQCMEWLADDDCGDPSHFAEGALMFTEIDPTTL